MDEVHFILSKDIVCRILSLFQYCYEDQQIWENITKIEKSSTHDVNHASNFFHLGIELAEFSHTEI